jgi:2-methoxy-6-polyprenyl-1,4-benzoquinol methylase
MTVPFLTDMNHLNRLTRIFFNRSCSRHYGTTHFGYKEVHEEEKETLVGQVFSRVANKYDIMNDAMSLGMHRFWKDAFVRRMYPQAHTKLLDVAGGTGDIAFRFLRQATKAPTVNSASTFHATIVDINPDMLTIGKKRATEVLSPDLQARIIFQQGNAQDLKEVPDNSVDIYSIAYGIRNCTHIDAVLKEAYRVLKPGGVFYCLEFSAAHPALAPFYDFWSFQIIPRLGELISNDRTAYQYFVESIRRFPSQDAFKKLIQGTGFRQVHYEDLSGGITTIHMGAKLP